jgi:DNA invertase Pin-like site-specific DNA recombinase
MLFGYVRISTKVQKFGLQVDALLKEGVDPKNIYSDTASGAKSERKGLDELYTKLREGDT